MKGDSSTSDAVSIVMLAFNEAGTIEEEVLRLHDAIVKRIPGSELIVAEDGSTDGTSEILARLSGSIGLIHLTGKERKGYKRAFLDALLAARNPYVFFCDSGGKHDPDEFWKLYAARDQFDLIVGKKTGRRDQRYRQALTWIYNFLLRTYFGYPVWDADSGFRLFNRNVSTQVLQGRLLYRNLISSEIVLRTIASGLRYGEVSVSYVGRKGESRGLPLRKIPKVTVEALRGMIALKYEIRAKPEKRVREASATRHSSPNV